ncbi:MAG: DUF2752 domain-containing protein [Lachnospiraceae bacterium]|nr:DUF2752 domain-containing protein [Lachnospiraceae bacterium]
MQIKGKPYLKEDIKKSGVVAAVIGIYLLVAKLIHYSVCPIVRFTGFPCPGCGMTRAVFALIKGDFGQAYEYHACVYLVIPFLLYCIVFRYLLGREIPGVKKILMVICIIVILYYIYRMATVFEWHPDYRKYDGDNPISYHPFNFINMVRYYWIS